MNSIRTILLALGRGLLMGAVLLVLLALLPVILIGAGVTSIWADLVSPRDNLF